MPPLCPADPIGPAIYRTPPGHRAALNRLENYRREAERILASWDAYSDEHTDPAGWPHDEHSYGLRQSQRDAQTAEAFDTVRDDARHLLDTAQAQLAQLPPSLLQTRWLYQLGVLRAALDQLDALHGQWLITRDSLPSDARPGSPVYDDALAEYHAECWSYLDDWSNHGQALLEIDSAARHAPAPGQPPAATATRSTSRTGQVHR